MKVTVKYFAALKDERGTGEETLDNSPATPALLYSQLKELHDFSFCTSKLKVAVNDEFSDWDSSLKDGDTVVFIPPVAGG